MIDEFSLDVLVAMRLPLEEFQAHCAKWQRPLGAIVIPKPVLWKHHTRPGDVVVCVQDGCVVEATLITEW